MIYSHTLCKNDQPFIDLVLRQVQPFMDKMLITVSEKSTDGTKAVVDNFKKEFKHKVEIDTENVKDPSELTLERQKQLDKTPDGAWVLFLDGDDCWPTNELHNLQMFLHTDVDGFAVNPYQLIDKDYYDSSWWNKWFTKLFKKQQGVHYERPWPRDLIFKDNEMLYWKTNKRVPRLPIRYIHLSYLKDYSFRNEPWAEDFRFTDRNKELLPLELREEINKIYESISNNSIA